MNIMLLLLVAAGVSLVIQNLLMVRITESVSTVLITLVINSSVGLVLLMGLLFAKNGVTALAEVTGSLRLWMLLPGLLGSFLCFPAFWVTRSWGRQPPLPYWLPASWWRD